MKKTEQDKLKASKTSGTRKTSSGKSKKVKSEGEQDEAYKSIKDESLQFNSLHIDLDDDDDDVGYFDDNF